MTPRRIYPNETLWLTLLAEYGPLSLRDMARAISRRQRIRLSHGTLQRALHGRLPRHIELRAALGLLSPEEEVLFPIIQAVMGALWEPFDDLAELPHPPPEVRLATAVAQSDAIRQRRRAGLATGKGPLNATPRTPGRAGKRRPRSRAQGGNRHG